MPLEPEVAEQVALATKHINYRIWSFLGLFLLWMVVGAVVCVKFDIDLRVLGMMGIVVCFAFVLSPVFSFKPAAKCPRCGYDWEPGWQTRSEKDGKRWTRQRCLGCDIAMTEKASAR